MGHVNGGQGPDSSPFSICPSFPDSGCLGNTAAYGVKVATENGSVAGSLEMSVPAGPGAVVPHRSPGLG